VAAAATAAATDLALAWAEHSARELPKPCIAGLCRFWSLGRLEWPRVGICSPFSGRFIPDEPRAVPIL
jgi:hypothetical protein